jgi:hypothetical protein
VDRSTDASRRAVTRTSAAPAEWTGLGRFSTDPMWHPVTVYALPEVLLVHRSGLGVIAETRRCAGGEVKVRDRRVCTELTLSDREGRVGTVMLPPRSTATAVLRTLGWVRGIESSVGSFRCRARTEHDGRPVRAYFDVGPDELGLSVSGRPTIRLHRQRGATVDGEQTMRKTYLRLGDFGRTHAYVELGRRDPALVLLRTYGWIDDESR